MKKICPLAVVFLVLAGLLRAEETLLSLLGMERIHAGGERTVANPAPAAEGKLTGVYFSAHWCPPCRAFTPTLVDMYVQAQTKGLDFDVIFVSFDRSEADMLAYMNETGMPWAALPFDSAGSTRAKEFKRDVLKSNGIPMLVILNSRGEVVTQEGRSDVQALGLQALNKWKTQAPEPAADKTPSPEKPAEPLKLPPPEKDKLTMTELNARLMDLDGKIIETSINRALSFEQTGKNKYRAFCYYYTASGGSYSGESVLIPEEGRKFFEELSQKGFSGSAQTVYLLIHSTTPVEISDGSYTYPYKLEAVGTRYRKNSDEYTW